MVITMFWPLTTLVRLASPPELPDDTFNLRLPLPLETTRSGLVGRSCAVMVKFSGIFGFCTRCFAMCSGLFLGAGRETTGAFEVVAAMACCSRRGLRPKERLGRSRCCGRRPIILRKSPLDVGT